MTNVQQTIPATPTRERPGSPVQRPGKVGEESRRIDGVPKVTGEFEPFVISGREPRPADIAEAEGSFSSGDPVFLKNAAGTPLAVGIAGVGSDRISYVNENDRLFQYIRVLN